MKKFLLGFLLLAAVPAFAQNPYVVSVTLNQNTASGPAAGWNMSGRGVTSYMFTWVTLGTVSAGACALVSSVESTFASPSTIIAAQTVTSSGSYATPTAANANFVRFACSTPISGTGSVTLTMFGLQPADAVASGGSTAANQELQITALNAIQAAVESTDPVAVTASTSRCNLPILYDTNTNGKTTLIAGVSTQVAHLCGIQVVNSTTSAVTVSFGTGTGSNCVTTYTAKTGAIVIPAISSGDAYARGYLLPVSAYGYWMSTTASENLCMQTNAAVSLQVTGIGDQY